MNQRFFILLLFSLCSGGSLTAAESARVDSFPQMDGQEGYTADGDSVPAPGWAVWSIELREAKLKVDLFVAFFLLPLTLFLLYRRR